MARPLRIEYSGALYHITSRGNEKKPIFKDDNDRKVFLDTLKKVNERYHWLCHAYCLMNNHYHLIIETPDANLSRGMRQLNGVYTQLFNKRHNRAGHIFQGRYKSILIERESYLLEVCRYVVLNPVRAMVVEKPEKWKWSSYCSTAGLRRAHSCLTTDWVLGQFDSRRREAEKRYREFVISGIGEDNLWGEVKGQSMLGRDEYVERLLKYVKRHESIAEIPRNQRYVGRPTLQEIFKNKLLDKQKRDQKITNAVYKYGYSQKEIADCLGMHYSTISRLIKMHEDTAKSKI